MDINEKGLVPQEQSPIEKINAALQELGITARWKRAPEQIPGTEVLKNKTIAMVDDSADVLGAFIPDLTVATDGKANFIKYDGQSVEELIAQIEQTRANLVLLDFHLSEMLKGSTVACAMREGGFTGSVVGFSSDSGAQKEFREAGALGAINKEAGFPESSVKKLAELLG